MNRQTPHPVMQFSALTCLVLSPVLMLTLKGGTGYCYFLFLALAAWFLRRSEHRARAVLLWRRYPLYVAGMMVLPLVVAFQLLVLRTAHAPALDPLLRLALIPVALPLITSLPARYLRYIERGFIAGALFAGIWAVYANFHRADWPMPGRLGNYFTNPIPFGDTALTLAFMSVIPLGRAHKPSRVLLAAAALAFAGGFYAAYLSGTRGNWLAIPVFIWAAYAGRPRVVRKRTRVALACLVVAAAVALGASDVVRSRTSQFMHDMQQMSAGNNQSSTGERIDLWKAAVLIYFAHPAFGVGRGSLEPALDALALRGAAPRAIVNAHAHNEFFSILAETGTAGVVALCLLYAGALVPFWRSLSDQDPDIRTAGYLGIAFCTSTIVYGLTIDVLPLVMNCAFFALTSATLLGWIESRRQELARKTTDPHHYPDSGVLDGGQPNVRPALNLAGESRWNERGSLGLPGRSSPTAAENRAPGRRRDGPHRPSTRRSASQGHTTRRQRRRGP